MTVILWRSSRDSNPGDTFMPYEISSHASSTSLSTPPWLAYYISRRRKKQGISCLVLLFCQFHDLRHFFHNLIVVFPAVGLQAAGAVFDSLFGITEIAAAVFAQAVQRTVTEKAAEPLRVRAFVAGEIFTGRCVRGCKTFRYTGLFYFIWIKGVSNHVEQTKRALVW